MVPVHARSSTPRCSWPPPRTQPSRQSTLSATCGSGWPPWPSTSSSAKTTSPLWPPSARLGTTLAQVDAALDRTRPDRVGALVDDPRPRGRPYRAAAGYTRRQGRVVPPRLRHRRHARPEQRRYIALDGMELPNRPGPTRERHGRPGAPSQQRAPRASRMGRTCAASRRRIRPGASSRTGLCRQNPALHANGNNLSPGPTFAGRPLPGVSL